MTSDLVIISVLYCVAILVRGSERAIAEETMHRNRRQLLYPNSTLFQVNIGFGTPTPIKTINVNWAMQANFQLPWNRTQIPEDILYANSGYGGMSRKKREDGDYENDAKLYHFYKYVEDALNSSSAFVICHYMRIGRAQQNVILLEFGAAQLGKYLRLAEDHSHNNIIYILSFGHNGTACVLKTLCQLGAEPLHTEQDDDLLHEISTFILNPSNDIMEHPCHEASPYVEAFRHGQKHLDCSRIFQCTSVSLLDLFTKTFDL